MTRVYLVTGRAARRLIERIASKLRAVGLEVYVVTLPVDVASLADPRLVESVLERLPRGSIAVLPPALRVDHSRLWAEHGVMVVYGPWSPEALVELLPRLLDRLEPGLVLEGFTSVECRGGGGTVYRLSCGLALASRPPPAVLLYEHFAARGVYRGGGVGHAVVLGFPRGVETRDALSVIEESRLPSCWGVDADNDRVILEAVDMGASIILSVDPRRIDLLSSLPKGVAVVLIPAGVGERLPPPHERLERLSRLAEEAASHGLIPVVDPLLAPPCLGLLDSLLAYRDASRLGYPMLAGLGNVYELIDADTPGVLALLASLLFEAGVSVYLVTGESWKARLAPLEAPIALLMACAACTNGRPPKDLGVSLLEARSKRPPAEPSPRPQRILKPGVDVEPVPFERDETGDNIVYAKGDGVIRIVHVWRDGRVEALEDSDPERLLRAAIAAGFVSRLDHAAWLGLEVGRADAYTRLGSGYTSLSPPRGAPRREEALEALRRLQEAR